MKNLFSSLILSAALAISASAATISFYDNNPADTAIWALNPSYTGEFTIDGLGDGKGFNPALHTLQTATIVFSFTDILGGSESFTITMTGFSQGGSNIPTWSSTPYGYDLELYPNTWADLAEDGRLSYTVKRNSGSFTLFNARLDATATVNSVPDSASVLSLLGLGLIGLASTRRFVRR